MNINDLKRIVNEKGVLDRRELLSLLNIIGSKQDSLTLKTIDGESIIGNGDISTAPVYKSYVANIIQTGTGDPVATILGINTLGDIAWNRNNGGDYTGTLTGAFDATKTIITLYRLTTSIAEIITLEVDTANTLVLFSMDASSSLVDGWNIFVEIKIYP